MNELMILNPKVADGPPRVLVAMMSEDWHFITALRMQWFKHDEVRSLDIEWEIYAKECAYIVDNAILNAQRYARVSV